ncbi:hypothetical protein BH09MYX1_BH09MYX1_64140 [soil metagenome]
MSFRFARGASLGVLFVVCSISTLPSVGCGATGSKRFAFEARAAGALRTDGATVGPLSFVNENGWTITLQKANVTLGPVYLNVIAPLRTAGFSGLSFVKTAHAAGDSHLDAGRVVGEVLGQVSFDALSQAEVPFATRGTITEEEVRTLDVWFYPAPGIAPETTKIATVALDVVGDAVKGADHVAFRGNLVLDDAWLPNAQPGARGGQTILGVRQVRGIPADFYPTEGGHLTMRFDVRACFRAAEFSNLSGSLSDPDGTKILVQAKSGTTTTDQVMTNLYQGVRATKTYSVAWTR